jgi:arylsulfatase A-like enzyme
VSEDHVGRALRTRRWKYEIVAPQANGWDDMAGESYVEAHLYDLENDPFELDNLAASPGHAQVRAQLRETLVRRMVAAGEPAPEITSAVPLAVEG